MLLLGIGLHRVHGPHGALDHREQRGPGVVAGPEELIEGVGDERVLFLAAIEGLVRHARDERRHRARLACHLRQHRDVTLVRAIARDEEHGDLRVPHLGRPDDLYNVRPRAGAPRLRSHAQGGDGEAIGRVAVFDLPLVSSIRCGHVALQRIRSGEMRDADEQQEQGGEKPEKPM